MKPWGCGALAVGWPFPQPGLQTSGCSLATVKGHSPPHVHVHAHTHPCPSPPYWHPRYPLETSETRSRGQQQGLGLAV